MTDGTDRRLTLNEESISKDYANENNIKILKEESNESSHGYLNGADTNDMIIRETNLNHDLIFPMKEIKINMTDTKKRKKESITFIKSNFDASGSKTIRRSTSKGRLRHLKVKTNKRMGSLMKDLISFGGKEPLTGLPNA